MCNCIRKRAVVISYRCLRTYFILRSTHNVKECGLGSESKSTQFVTQSKVCGCGSVCMRVCCAHFNPSTQIFGLTLNVSSVITFISNTFYVYLEIENGLVGAAFVLLLIFDLSLIQNNFIFNLYSSKSGEAIPKGCASEMKCKNRLSKISMACV